MYKNIIHIIHLYKWTISTNTIYSSRQIKDRIHDERLQRFISWTDLWIKRTMKQTRSRPDSNWSTHPSSILKISAAILLAVVILNEIFYHADTISLPSFRTLNFAYKASQLKKTTWISPLFFMAWKIVRGTVSTVMKEYFRK